MLDWLRFLDATTKQCTACDHTSCPDDAYRVGQCKGTTNGFRCELLGEKATVVIPATTPPQPTPPTMEPARTTPPPDVLFDMLDYDGDGELMFDDISKYCAESGCNATRAANQIGGNRTRAAFLLAFDTSRDLVFLFPPSDSGTNVTRTAIKKVNASGSGERIGIGARSPDLEVKNL